MKRVLACSLTVVAVTLLMSACTSEPRNPVPDSTMVDVMVELHLLNARIELSGRPVEGTRDSILTEYGLDSARYEQALTYYAEHPVEYGALYGRVVDELAAEPATPLDSTVNLPVLSTPSP